MTFLVIYQKMRSFFVIGLHELRRQHLWHKKEIKIHVTVTCQLFNGKNKFLNFFQDFILVLDKRNDFFQFFFQRSKRESTKKITHPNRIIFHQQRIKFELTKTALEKVSLWFVLSVCYSVQPETRKSYNMMTSVKAHIFI